MTEPNSDTKNDDAFGPRELEAIKDKVPISAPAIFESIRRKGIEELNRPISALVLSALVAGLALGFSVLAEALFRHHLPDADWRPLVENFGYSVGFLIVILGQMQLFTENTITAVCPVLDTPSGSSLFKLCRLWSLVLIFNLIGASIFGYVLYATRGFQPEIWFAILDLSRHATSFPWGETMLRGIGAGWLIAALVWIMPNAENSRPILIILITYLIALADFSHVIAGTTEAAALVFSGDLSLGAATFSFVAPAFFGNILGGTVFFTVLTWVQIRTELAEKERAAR